MNSDATRTQYGAVCWRMYKERLEILLVTSRDTGRWIIPKGWAVPGLSAAGSAEREAWEEAGVEGKLSETCIGLYSYDKVLGPEQSVPCVVAVYPIEVARLRDRFPERGQRKRKWFTPDKAARKVGEPELKEILMRFAPPEETVAENTPKAGKPEAAPKSG